jgi:hypothetical protein
MVIACPNLKCGLSKGHISVILASSSAPFVWPTCLPKDDLVKQSDDLSMLSHTNLGNPLGIQYLGQ